MLPKEILADLESGDRTKEFLVPKTQDYGSSINIDLQSHILPQLQQQQEYQRAMQQQMTHGIGVSIRRAFGL